MFLALVVLPYVILLACYLLLMRLARRPSSPSRELLLYPLICSLVLTCGFVVWGQYSIATSRSSTAPIGYLFLPFYSLAVGVAGFLISWSIFYLVRAVIESRRGGSFTAVRVVLSGLAVLVLCTAGMATAKWLVRQRQLNAAASIVTHPLEVRDMVVQAIATHDLDIMALLARNPNTSVKDLEQIYDSCQHRLADFNPLEYKVFFALAQNDRTPAEILTNLAECKQSTVRWAVGRNPNAPKKTLEKLANDKDQSVRYWLASNPNLSSEVLRQLANDTDEGVQRHARQYLGREAEE